VSAYRAWAAEGGSTGPAVQPAVNNPSKAEASKDVAGEQFDATREKASWAIARVIMEEAPNPAAQPAPSTIVELKVVKWLKKGEENPPEKISVGFLASKTPFPLKRECTVYLSKTQNGKLRLVGENTLDGISHIAPVDPTTGANKADPKAPANPAPADPNRANGNGLKRNPPGGSNVPGGAPNAPGGGAPGQ
jgi:hypothetical protein